MGCIPGADWQIDFTNMPKVKKHKYLLVLVDTFSEWVEAFPTSNKRASTSFLGLGCLGVHVPGDPNNYQGP
jgi:hypothetical protein